MDVLFVNHSQKNCGVQQFGQNTYNIIKESKNINFIYATCDSRVDLYNYLHNSIYWINKILFNYYPSTMPWINHPFLSELNQGGYETYAIFHEVPITGFNYYIHPDPTFEETENRFKVGRPIFSYEPLSSSLCRYPYPKVGSFGFGFGNKGWEEILRTAKRDLENPLVRFNIPYAYFGDRDGSSALKIANYLYDISAEIDILLDIGHDFLETPALLDFLGANDINCFFYDELYGRGIASTLDYALSVKKPIALTKSYMFRHLFDAKPSIFIEDLPLNKILENGIKPLEPFYEMFTGENLIKDYERIFLNG